MPDSLLALAKRTRKSTQVNAKLQTHIHTEVAYGLAMGGQKDPQFGSQVHASRN